MEGTSDQTREHRKLDQVTDFLPVFTVCSCFATGVCTPVHNSVVQLEKKRAALACTNPVGACATNLYIHCVLLHS